MLFAKEFVFGDLLSSRVIPDVLQLHTFFQYAYLFPKKASRLAKNSTVLLEALSLAIKAML